MSSSEVAHLVDGEVDAGVGDDADDVGHVSAVEGDEAVAPVRLEDAVPDVCSRNVLVRLVISD